MSSYISAFFAFPNEPTELRSTITAAARAADQNPNLTLVTWPQLEIFGAIIPDKIKQAIEKSKVVICDITLPNLNVYYEIGFAIGLGKTIAPVLNAAFANAAQNVQKDGLFDIIGYKTYENSAQLQELLTVLPHTILLDLYSKPLNTHQPLFFLNALRKTDFVNGIGSAVKESGVYYRSFDPAENPRFMIVPTINDITSSAGVIVPFLEDYLDDSARHNIRGAFLAGLAHGLGRETLLLRHQTRDAPTAPADFRDAIINVRNEAELYEIVSEFSAKTLIAAQSIRAPSARSSQSALQRLTLGATAAENEFRTLDDYFVATSEFLRTSRGEAGIVAGRKGSGKSAIFFMVRDHFRQYKRTIVVDLRPESHQLSLFKAELAAILEIGAYDHTIAAFWYFVVVSELLLKLQREIEFQIGKSSAFSPQQSLEVADALQSLGVSASGDFTARINRLGSYIMQEVRSVQKKGDRLSPERLTNIVFRGGIADAKKLVAKHAAKFDQFVFLFDNIDKGWAPDGVDDLDVRLVRLLLESLDKVKSDLAAERLDFISTVFLRNDVLELMVSRTPDKGKAAVVRIDWTDRVKLRQVIFRRLQASVADKPKTFEAVWRRFFVETVGSQDTFEYFVDHSLMRPRFLIGIIEIAIANAINRAHELVMEEDCIDAVRQHSHSILNDFGYEIRDVSGASERVLHSLVGSTEFVTKGEIIEKFERAQVIEPGRAEKLFSYMLWYGVLGVVNENNIPCYIYDFDYNMNRLDAEILSQSEEALFSFNPALHVALKTKGPKPAPRISSL
jgi:hypothetical protein